MVLRYILLRLFHFRCRIRNCGYPAYALRRTLSEIDFPCDGTRASTVSVCAMIIRGGDRSGELPREHQAESFDATHDCNKNKEITKQKKRTRRNQSGSAAEMQILIP